MDKHCTIVFPHQLFESHPAIAGARSIFLIEEQLFFKQYLFHQQKLVLHRASLKYYEQHLIAKGHEVVYIDASNELSDSRLLLKQLHSLGYTQLHCCALADDWLTKRIKKAAKKYQLRLNWYTSAGFLSSAPDANAFFDQKKRYFHADFYSWQRKFLNILVNEKGEPIGGKWSFDAENQQKLPKQQYVPALALAADNEFTIEAINYVEKNFKANYGQAKPFYYPVTHEAAKAWLDDFLSQRFLHFGRFEDAMVAGESYLFHSVLTPVLNIGLLTPQQVVTITLAYAKKNNTPINSVEGFIRQVIGWREFMALVYHREGSHQRTRNFWQFSRKIPSSFYNGTTGILPVDKCIQKLMATGYNHHIERLMVLGNFFLLCEFDPNQVYQWFMEMYIDSYDWVMVPNVYGMSQFADGGIITTKPYISGSNYLFKLGDWPKGPWQIIWDALFWRFMHQHRNFFTSNPRLGMLLGTWDKMADEKKQQHLSTANHFLQQLDASLTTNVTKHV
jgi:deoxyribodipyrimidine photolyase-related protein